MKDGCWLILKEDGIRRMVKGRRSRWDEVKRPALGQGEYAVWIEVQVPASVFKPARLPSATITVPESAVLPPAVAVEVATEPPGEELATIPNPRCVVCEQPMGDELSAYEDEEVHPRCAAAHV